MSREPTACRRCGSRPGLSRSRRARQTSVDVAAAAGARAAGPVLRASASVVKFPGFLAAYAAAHFRGGAARDAGADGTNGTNGGDGADEADGGGEGGEGEGAALPALKVRSAIEAM